jgi:hypothetical protein
MFQAIEEIPYVYGFAAGDLGLTFTDGRKFGFRRFVG